MEKIQGNERGNFKLNMDFLHNKVLENFVNGDGLMVNAADTIVTDELREEFGKYVANVKYDIITLLFGKLQATQYMTTKMTEKNGLAGHSVAHQRFDAEIHPVLDSFRSIQVYPDRDSESQTQDQRADQAR